MYIFLYLQGDIDTSYCFQTLSDIDFLSDTEAECAPKIVKQLPEVITTKDGHVTK